MLANSMENWKQLLDKPFARLVRHCVDRIFAGSDTADPGELDLGIGMILAMLAAPGAFISMILSDRYGSLLRFIRGQQVAFNPYTASASDEYFFIVLAMVIAASVAVWKWDRLLPDRRDFANLAHLPISHRTILSANLFAILILSALFSLDVNAVSAVLFPVFVTFQSSFEVFLKFFLTHLIAVFLAGAFGFLAVFAVLGATMSLVPFRLFRKLSFYVRCLLLFYLASLLATGFTPPKAFLALARKPVPWTRVPPPAWFLGFCETMRGSGGPALASVGRVSVWAFLLAVLLAVLSFSFGYRRSYSRSAEAAGSQRLGGTARSVVFRWMDKLLLRNGFERGCYRFALRTIFRSQEQAFVLGTFVTIGIVLASQTLLRAMAAGAPQSETIPSPGFLSIFLILGFFLVIGLYAIFSIPASLRSNWVFRFHVDKTRHKSPSVARKVVFTFLFPLLIAPCFAVYSRFWGWRIGALHAAFVAVWCALLLEGLLVKFHKIPFTCTMPAFKDHAIVTAVLFLLVYFAFTSMTATLENWAIAAPLWFLAFLPVISGLLLVFRQQRRGLIDADRQLVFEEKPPPVVETMNLAR
jgi:hypothetical protein